MPDTKKAGALVAAMAALTLGGGMDVQAAELRPVSCSVSIDYLRNNDLRSSYKRDFSVLPGGRFYEDLSTATRFSEFEATTSLRGDDTVVSISYYKDVTVFDTMDVRFEAVLVKGNGPAYASGISSHTAPAPSSTSTFVYVENENRYTLTCNRLKD